MVPNFHSLFPHRLAQVLNLAANVGHHNTDGIIRTGISLTQCASIEHTYTAVADDTSW